MSFLKSQGYDEDVSYEKRGPKRVPALTVKHILHTTQLVHKIPSMYFFFLHLDMCLSLDSDKVWYMDSLSI